jgi:hypothetical protein
MRSQFADGGGQFSGEVYTNSNPSLAQYTVGQIPTSTSTFVTTRPSGPDVRHSPPRFGAYRVIDIFPHLQTHTYSTVQIIDDGYVDQIGAANTLRLQFDILMLGHQEYVTQNEYDTLKGFVDHGGVLVCLDGNLFYGEVSYNPSSNTVQFVRGHRWSYDSSNNIAYFGVEYERWASQTQEWLGSNFYIMPQVQVLPSYDYQHVLTKYANNPFGYHKLEEQMVTNPANVNIIQDYRAYIILPKGAITSTATQPLANPQIATYWKSHGTGRVIVFGLYTDQLNTNQAFLQFFDHVMIQFVVPALKS